MAKEASVAPKERINIVYKPATGDAQEEVELPLKVVVMGDFTLRPDDTPLEERKPVNLDKDTTLSKQVSNTTRLKRPERDSNTQRADLLLNNSHTARIINLPHVVLLHEVLLRVVVLLLSINNTISSSISIINTIKHLRLIARVLEVHHDLSLIVPHHKPHLK